MFVCLFTGGVPSSRSHWGRQEGCPLTSDWKNQVGKRPTGRTNQKGPYRKDRVGRRVHHPGKVGRTHPSSGQVAGSLSPARRNRDGGS